MHGWVAPECSALSRSAGPATTSSAHAPSLALRGRSSGRLLHSCQWRRTQHALDRRRRAQCSSSPLVTEDEAARPQQGAERRAPIATLQARKAGTLDVEEGPRPLAEYMALPASQYSVLDAERIERIDDSTFRCYVGGLRLFSLVVEPVLTVSVVVDERGPTVKLLETQLQGSPIVEAANDRFSATMTNVVRWSDAAASAAGAGAQRKQLRSDTEIQVALEVPGWMRVVPVGAIERTGSGVMQRVLDSMVPRFLSQLAADYARWAAGDASRTPIGTGQL